MQLVASRNRNLNQLLLFYGTLTFIPDMVSDLPPPVPALAFKDARIISEKKYEDFLKGLDGR